MRSHVKWIDHPLSRAKMFSMMTLEIECLRLRSELLTATVTMRTSGQLTMKLQLAIDG